MDVVLRVGDSGLRSGGVPKLDSDFLAVTIRGTAAVVRCPCCGTKNVIREGTVSRRLRGLPVGRQQVWFEAQVPRVSCSKCQITRPVRIPFAEEKRRHTRAFERYALELAQIATTADAARHLGVAWDTVRGIEARSLKKKFTKPKLKHLKQLAIDEIDLGKSMKYRTYPRFVGARRRLCGFGEMGWVIDLRGRSACGRGCKGL